MDFENYINSAVSNSGVFKTAYIDKMIPLFDAVTFATVSNIISYVLVILMILSAMRSISIALGGEVNLYGLSKVI